MGRMGNVEFCQRLSLEPGDRTGHDVFREWTRRMVASIRKHDQTHLITVGMLPFPRAYTAVAEQLDFVSPHLYPKSDKVNDEIRLLQKFDWGNRLHELAELVIQPDAPVRIRNALRLTWDIRFLVA